MARFAQWKAALLSLRHPHVAPMVDAGVTDQGAVYVASRYVGGSALTMVAAGQSVSPADRVELGRQLADAVGAIHSAGLVHLKLDASKVKVSVSGGAHLTVLGLGSALVIDGLDGPPEADRAAVARILSELGLNGV
jgi:serine/threonine protein kinase